MKGLIESHALNSRGKQLFEVGFSPVLLFQLKFDEKKIFFFLASMVEC